MILILPQVKVEATDPLMVKAGTDNLEVSHNETGQKPQYSQGKFQNCRFQRGTFQQNRIQYSSNRKSYFQGNQTNSYREAVAGALNVVMAEPIVKVAMAITSISITRMAHRQNSMAHLVVYVAVLIIPLSTDIRENMT